MKQKTVQKYIRLLAIVQLLSLLSSILFRILPRGSWTQYVPLLFQGLTLFCIFRLRAEHKFYRFAVWMTALYLISSLLQNIVSSLVLVSYLYRAFGQTVMDIVGVISRILSGISLLLSWLAIYFEYTAHARLVFAPDPVLSRQWRILAVATVAVLFCASIAGMISAAAVESGALLLPTYQHNIYPILRFLPIPVKIAYLLFLFRTYGVLRKGQKGDNGNFSTT